jgi:hypothetical protein
MSDLKDVPTSQLHEWLIDLSVENHDNGNEIRHLEFKIIRNNIVTSDIKAEIERRQNEIFQLRRRCSI